MDIFNGIISNCDEMLEFLVETYGCPIQDDVIFEGNAVHVDGYMPDLRLNSMLIVSPKYNRTVFIVGDDNGEGEFLLSIIKKEANFDQTYGVMLPMSVRLQMIATANGVW